jgi:hypothetical protein
VERIDTPLAKVFEYGHDPPLLKQEGFISRRVTYDSDIPDAGFPLLERHVKKSPVL